MLVSHQFAHLHELAQRRLFPHHIGAIDRFDDIKDAWFKQEEPAIDQVGGAVGLFLKAQNLAGFIIIEMTKGRMRINHGHGRQLAMRFVEFQRLGDVGIRQPVAIGKRKCIAIIEIGAHQLQPPTGHALDTSVNQINHPGGGGHVKITHAVFLAIDLTRIEIDPKIAFVLRKLRDVFLD